MNFLNFDILTNRLTIIEHEYVAIRCFKELRLKHKQPQKYTLEQEFLYIWFNTHIASPGIQQGLGEIDLHTQATIKFDMIDYKPDAIILECIDYINNERSAIEISLVELYRSIENTNKLIKYVNTFLETLVSAKAITNQDIGLFFGYQDKIQNIIATSPELLKKLVALKTDYEAVQKGTKLGRGNISISNSMLGTGEENL